MSVRNWECVPQYVVECSMTLPKTWERIFYLKSCGLHSLQGITSCKLVCMGCQIPSLMLINHSISFHIFTNNHCWPLEKHGIQDPFWTIPSSYACGGGEMRQEEGVWRVGVSWIVSHQYSGGKRSPFIPR